MPSQSADGCVTPIDDPTATKDLRRTVAETYAAGFDAVQQYDRVMRYAGENPSKGSHAVATAVDLPRGRIRPWLDGSKPDPIHALDVLSSRGWDDLDWLDPPFTGLNVLVAWIFGGGSINDRWAPRFAVAADAEQTGLDRALQEAGVDGAYIRGDESGRATEFDVSEDASVLGRLLAVLGAPLGEKGTDRSLSLPPYLDAAPYPVRLDFARAYVRCRATPRPDRPGRPLQIREERSAEYRRAIRAFLADVGHADWLGGSGESDTWTLTARGAALFGADPVFGEWPP